VSEPELVVVSADEQRDGGQLAEALPATLPVLPLKETVMADVERIGVDEVARSLAELGALG